MYDRYSVGFQSHRFGNLKFLEDQLVSGAQRAERNQVRNLRRDVFSYPLKVVGEDFKLEHRVVDRESCCNDAEENEKRHRSDQVGQDNGARFSGLPKHRNLDVDESDVNQCRLLWVSVAVADQLRQWQRVG